MPDTTGPGTREWRAQCRMSCPAPDAGDVFKTVPRFHGSPLEKANTTNVCSDYCPVAVVLLPLRSFHRVDCASTPAPVPQMMLELLSRPTKSVPQMIDSDHDDELVQTTLVPQMMLAPSFVPRRCYCCRWCPR